MPNHRLLVDDQEKLKNEIGKEDERPQEEKRMLEAKGECKGSKEIDLEIDLLAFPQTIIEELADHLVLLDYMNFCAVCRRLSMAAPVIRWREASKIASAETCSLFFMFVGGDRKVYNLIDSKFSGRYFMRIPDELKDATMCYSKDGWLLMCKTHVSMLFFNPFTGVVLRCPDKPIEGVSFAGFLFSSILTSSDCLVIGITTHFGSVVLHILGYGRDEVWRVMEFENQFPFEPNYNNPVFWNGAYFFLGQDGNLGVLKPDEGSYIWNVLDKPRPPCKSFNHNFLVECDKELLSIFVGDYVREVGSFQVGSIFSRVE